MQGSVGTASRAGKTQGMQAAIHFCMDANEPGWELYRTFLGVLEAGSQSGAARALGVAQPTVGRHIEALEQALGQVLFTRSPSGYLPTEAALALQPYAQALQAAAAALLRAAAGQGEGVRGTVRISASEVVGVELLPPILATLRREQPQLSIELSLSNQVEDLLRHEADIAVRMLRPTQEALLARRVGAIELGLHARADYLERSGTPQSLQALIDEGHALIGFDRETAFIRSQRGVLGPVQRQHFALRADSDLAQLAAVRAGLGLGICQVPLARRDPALRRVLAQDFAPRLDTWVVMHEDLRASRPCKTVFDALVAGLDAYIGGG